MKEVQNSKIAGIWKNFTAQGPQTVKGKTEVF